MSTMTPQLTSRDTRRLQTRERILGAAIAEFKRAGTAGAEVNAVVTAAGVAHGTFYFHFPTKEHVLLELERREETRVAAALARFLDTAQDLRGTLAELVTQVMGIEQRLGPILFKEILALHFSPTRPDPEDWTDHAVIVQLVREIEIARRNGSVHPEVEAFYSAVFFLLGVYGVLTTTDDVEARKVMLDKLIASAVRGLEVR